MRKFLAFCIALVAVSFFSAADAQPPGQAWRGDSPYADAKERREAIHNRHELRQHADSTHGDEMRRDRHELIQDRKEVHQDRRELRQDRRAERHERRQERREKRHEKHQQHKAD